MRPRHRAEVAFAPYRFRRFGLFLEWLQQVLGVREPAQANVGLDEIRRPLAYSRLGRPAVLYEMSDRLKCVHGSLKPSHAELQEA